MINEKAILLILVFGVIAFYFGFRWMDTKTVKDERENLIHLKALEAMHTITTTVFSLLTLSWVFIFYTQLNSIYFIVAMFVSWQLSYPLAKIYFRQKI